MRVLFDHTIQKFKLLIRKMFTVIRPIVCLSGPMLDIPRHFVLIGASCYTIYSKIATNPDKPVKKVSEYD